jgi:hypothetical protein
MRSAEDMVSPILVRPVREQLEHDRIIRLLPARYRRRFEVGINPGSEQNAAVGTGLKAVYPDAVFYGSDRVRKVLGIAEVETVESVNHLEAMAEWASFGRLKVLFHLYVPASAIDVARQMASDYRVALNELWSYDNVGDQVRFTLIQRAPEPSRPSAPKPRPPARKAVRSVGPAAGARGSSRAQRPTSARGAAGRAKAPSRTAKPSATRAGAGGSKSRKTTTRKAQRRR